MVNLVIEEVSVLIVLTKEIKQATLLEILPLPLAEHSQVNHLLGIPPWPILILITSIWSLDAHVCVISLIYEI